MNNNQLTITLTGNSLTINQVKAAARDFAKVSITKDAAAKCRRGQEIIQYYIDRKDKIYGVTTGFGSLSKYYIEPDKADQVNRSSSNRNQMKLPKHTIINTSGQWTPILEGTYPSSTRATIGQQLLGRYPLAGQVAFIDLESATPIITMMGNELSINGTLASSYYLMKKFDQSKLKLKTSGVIKPLTAEINRNKISCIFPSAIVKSVTNDEVIFTGIKYKFVLSEEIITKSAARKYCGRDQAAGFIICTKHRIIPIVYVKATDTLVQETACGSASLAYYLKSNQEIVIQPSDQSITINQFNNQFIISTKAERMLK